MFKKVNIQKLMLNWKAMISGINLDYWINFKIFGIMLIPNNQQFGFYLSKNHF